MTRTPDGTLSDELVDLIADAGLDAVPELLPIIIKNALHTERQPHLHAAPYERTAERRGDANGFKPKTMPTQNGKITFAVPQVRAGSCYPQALEKGLRSERAFTLALAEMYVQGVSTRKVAAITEQLCGVELTSTQVSRAAAQLDAVLERWRTRPLGETPYLLLDARYEKVRIDGQVRDAAVLLALGVTTAGKRTILGVSVSVSEHEAHWFLPRLIARGLRGVQLITSDAHTGLSAARVAGFGGVPWQRCQFHRQQNARASVPHQELYADVADRYPGHLHRAESVGSRGAAGPHGAEVRQNGIQTGGVDGDRAARRLDHLRRPSRAPAAPPHGECVRTPESSDPPPYPRCWGLSQRSRLPAAGERHRHGDQR